MRLTRRAVPHGHGKYRAQVRAERHCARSDEPGPVHGKLLRGQCVGDQLVSAKRQRSAPQFAVGGSPEDLAVDPANHTVYVSNSLDGTVSMVAE